MPISLTCTSCSRALRVRDELAGRQILCPDCQTKITVPAGDFSPPLPSAEAQGNAFRFEQPKEDPFSARAEMSPPTKPRLDDDFDDADRPIRRPPPPPKPKGEFGSINAGVGGGILMMVIAIVWFVLGLIFGWIFYYPPILFIIGLVAFIKGLVTRE